MGGMGLWLDGEPARPQIADGIGQVQAMSWD